MTGRCATRELRLQTATKRRQHSCAEDRQRWRKSCEIKAASYRHRPTTKELFAPPKARAFTIAARMLCCCAWPMT